jgi:DNA primase
MTYKTQTETTNTPTQENINLYARIVESVDIVDTLSKYTKLENTGSYFEGKCPFNEKCGKSFCVSRSQKSFFCFGCHSRGDVITFIARIGNMNKATAARFLSNLQKSESWSDNGAAIE